MDIYRKLIEASKAGKSYALATIVDTKGCTPRSEGTKMLVFEDGRAEGTVGGGTAESLCIKDCLDAMKSGCAALKNYSPETIRAQGQEAGCIKNITVFIEPVKAQPMLYLAGGGNIAQAVLPLAKHIGFYVTVFETRDTSGFSDVLNLADEIVRLDSYSELKEHDISTFASFLVCTHSHGTDEEAIGAVLDKNLAYVGMLGAMHKFEPIFAKLRASGFSSEQIDQIYAPAGLDIGGETTDEIAISIISEIMAVRYGKTCMHLRDRKRRDRTEVNM